MSDENTYGNGTIDDWKFYESSGWMQSKCMHLEGLKPYHAIAELIAEVERLSRERDELREEAMDYRERIDHLEWKVDDLRSERNYLQDRLDDAAAERKFYD